jgi:uncharacterized protein (TIGR03435 family)
MAAWGQAGASAPAGSSTAASAFEIVSIKPANPDERGRLMQSLPDGFRWTNFPIASLVQGAYGTVMESQIVGMPGWVQSDPYDIETKVDAETAEAWKKLTYKERWKQEGPMMRSLLADRCKLQVHRETRDLPVYDLVIAKGGLKMKESPADGKDAETMSSGRMSAHAISTDSLVYGFSSQVGRMIVDKTGLGEKKFDFELKWTPDDRRAADASPDAGPDLFTAIEEQLGLKLVPSRGPVDVIVIDHIEKPSEN